MILAMPNSGSDLLVESIRNVLGLTYFEKEFFNPITNLPMCDQLLAAKFGCETISGAKNLWKPLKDDDDSIIEYHKNDFQLWKEVFWFGKQDYYLKHFDVILMHRDLSDIFPPSRLRVLQWYEAIAGVKCNKHTFLSRVNYGYTKASKLVTLLEGFGVPCLHSQNLVLGNYSETLSDWLDCTLSDAMAITSYYCTNYRPKNLNHIKYKVAVNKQGSLSL